MLHKIVSGVNGLDFFLKAFNKGLCHIFVRLLHDIQSWCLGIHLVVKALDGVAETRRHVLFVGFRMWFINPGFNLLGKTLKFREHHERDSYRVSVVKGLVGPFLNKLGQLDLNRLVVDATLFVGLQDFFNVNWFMNL